MYVRRAGYWMQRVSDLSAAEFVQSHEFGVDSILRECHHLRIVREGDDLCTPTKFGQRSEDGRLALRIGVQDDVVEMTGIGPCSSTWRSRLARRRAR